MKYSVRCLATLVLALFCGAAEARAQTPMLFQVPTVSRTHVAFSCAGDIWIVDRRGGDARRLTTSPARETYPVLSPDGLQVAFTRFNPAGGPFSWDVYVVSVSDGAERRLTYHPDLDFPINWTPDGKNVLLLSFRQRTSLLGGRLCTVPAQGGFAVEVPVPRGWAGSFSPNGDRIAYTPLVNTRDVFAWRNYRGGATSKIWLVRLADGTTEEIPHVNFNDVGPMWVGDKVYFVSDRSWRRLRENFYDPNLHGQNLAELQAHYAAYLPGIATREDLNTLFKEMLSHLSVSHMGVIGGDVGVPQGEVKETIGLLGADFDINSGRYRIKRILRGDNTRGIASPLAQPGVNVTAGEYLLAVDGEEIKADEDLYRYFLNKALKSVQLKVAPTPDGKEARTITITPISSEVQLRQYDWVEGNRLRVQEMSSGKLGYIYLADTADVGYNAFNREFYGQLEKQGLVVDGRFNEGGRAADYIIETLGRVPLQHAQLRDGEDVQIPIGIINGPKVLITNEMAGSGGDSLPWMWQQMKVGPVVGIRTDGAGVGASTYQLIDGGSFRVPDWGWYDPRTGAWLMENRGVKPDYELEVMPPDWRAGRDPQLEKAIQLALDAMKKERPTTPRRPSFPVYK